MRTLDCVRSGHATRGMERKREKHRRRPYAHNAPAHLSSALIQFCSLLFLLPFTPHLYIHRRNGRTAHLVLARCRSVYERPVSVVPIVSIIAHRYIWHSLKRN